MLANCAGWQLLKLIPVIHDPIAASPALLQVVENRLTRVEVATALLVLLGVVVLETPMSLAPHAHQFNYYVNIHPNRHEDSRITGHILIKFSDKAVSQIVDHDAFGSFPVICFL